MNNSIDTYAARYEGLVEKWITSLDGIQPYPNILAEFMVASRREGWKALITFHTCVIPGAKKVLDTHPALGANGVFCTVIVKGRNGYIDKSGGFSICNNDDEWSGVAGMRVALKDALVRYDYNCENMNFIRRVWQGFVKNVVQKEARLIE